MPTYRVREGLPPYGAPAIPFPADFGRLSREGLVVEFRTEGGAIWNGNFQPGLGGLSRAINHPDGRRVIVFSAGDAWVVDVDRREAERVAPAILGCWAFEGDLVLSRQGLAFLRIGPAGVVWHTRSLSWDGFEDVRIVGSRLQAQAWSAMEQRWVPCSVDLISGRSDGGGYGDGDPGHWERLASNSPR